MADGAAVRVSIVAMPGAMPSTLLGLHDVLSSAGGVHELLASIGAAPGPAPRPAPEPFAVEIVGERRGPLRLTGGLPVEVERPLNEVASTDLVLAPSLLVDRGDWSLGRHPELIDWLGRMHAGGALLCSACSGLYPIAETGLVDGREATIHWNYASGFRRGFPGVPLSPEKVMVVSGERSEFVTSGASSSWHDLALYLVARHVGPTTAQAVAKFFAFQWHVDGLAPYAVFDPGTEHGDAVIADIQRWIGERPTIARPVDEMRLRSGLSERSFSRRFRAATGHTPIAYVQGLRVEDAKRRLERTDTPVERIAWEVGYEDPAAFRRLFRRVTGVTPAVYRKRFQLPSYAQPGTNA